MQPHLERLAGVGADGQGVTFVNRYNLPRRGGWGRGYDLAGEGPCDEDKKGGGPEHALVPTAGAGMFTYGMSATFPCRPRVAVDRLILHTTSNATIFGPQFEKPCFQGLFL